MTENSSSINQLLQSSESDNHRELVELFETDRQRLTQMVRLRMDRRLQGRVTLTMC